MKSRCPFTNQMAPAIAPGVRQSRRSAQTGSSPSHPLDIKLTTSRAHGQRNVQFAPTIGRTGRTAWLEVYRPDGELEEIYVNIGSPVEVTGLQLHITDYELDVVLQPPVWRMLLTKTSSMRPLSSTAIPTRFKRSVIRRYGRLSRWRTVGKRQGCPRFQSNEVDLLWQARQAWSWCQNRSDVRRATGSCPLIIRDISVINVRLEQFPPTQLPLLARSFRLPKSCKYLPRL